MCVASHAQITQNKKFVISLQYLQKQVSDEVDFLHADKHQIFLQMNDMIVDGGWSSIPKIPKITGLQYLCNISKKPGKNEVAFCWLIKIKDFFKSILSI